MELSKVSYHAFVRHLRSVRCQLEDKREQARLLDAAREDTPVIESLLQVLSRFLGEPEETRNEDAVAFADRDLQVFLALRSLEAEQRAAAAATVVPVRTGGHRRGDGHAVNLN